MQIEHFHLSCPASLALTRSQHTKRCPIFTFSARLHWIYQGCGVEPSDWLEGKLASPIFSALLLFRCVPPALRSFRCARTYVRHRQSRFAPHSTQMQQNTQLSVRRQKIKINWLEQPFAAFRCTENAMKLKGAESVEDRGGVTHTRSERL